MSSSASSPSPEIEFKTKTFFTRALMLSKFIRIAISKPKSWLQNGLKFLSKQLMFIAVGFWVIYACSHIFFHAKNATLPFSFFEEYKVEIEGQVQCCTKDHCHNVSYIGVDLIDDNIFYQDSMLNDTITDQNGFFYISAKSKQLGKMRPYLQVHHVCNTGDLNPTAARQIYRISWYRVPDYHVVPSSLEDHITYLLYPLSLNGEGFIETIWEICPFTNCTLQLDDFNETKYANIVKKYMYYAL